MGMSSRITTAMVGTLAVAIWLAFGAQAQDGGGGKAEARDAVIASVNGEKIMRSDVEEALSRLPQQYRQYPPEVLFNLLVNSIIDTKLAAAAALKQNLDKDRAVVDEIARIREQILEKVYVERHVEQTVTEDKLKEAYEIHVKENPGKEEVRASHILVETEEQALEVLSRLGKGEDFTELAKTLSKGPSRRAGGDLGYFTRDQMVPEFANAAFELKNGETTKAPVRTQFGWHVIMVVDHRTSAPSSFEETRAELKEKVSYDAAAGVMKKLREDAEIVRYDPDGNPVREQPERSIRPVPAEK
jgi:peptidyl-prolyl cis-trans isomerase C